ncbi:MAG: HAD family hydrolase [Ignavibacterium sp.]|nr:MAG: HAD family hydrolase [Ignavibacterium sp.]
MEIEHVCFDLDGTIVKSDKTIYKSTLKAMEDLNINGSIDEKQFNQMIGMHFVDIFEVMKIDVPDFEEFIRIYKSHYFDFINESVLYPDIEEILAYLREEKKIKISLLTTKGQDQAEKIINYFYLDKFFDFIMGRREGVEHKPSPEPLLMICDDLNVKSANTMMIGDTEIDIKCGKNAGAITCAVSYGFRSEETLIKNKPDYIYNSVKELQQFLSDGSN